MLVVLKYSSIKGDTPKCQETEYVERTRYVLCTTDGKKKV